MIKKKTADGNSKAKNSKRKKRMPKTVQEFIGMTLEGITSEGIVVSNNNTYSKLYSLVDANFLTETPDKQKRILDSFSNLINRFADNIDVSIIIVNERNTKEDLSKAYHFQLQGDNLDVVREDYNNMIDAKIATSHTEISKNKYIMLTYHGAEVVDKNITPLSKAESELAIAETSLQEGVKGINAKAGVKLVDGFKRLELMHKILNGIDTATTFEKEYSSYFNRIDKDGEISYEIDPKNWKKKGMTCCNMIAPQILSMTKQQIQLAENRYC